MPTKPNMRMGGVDTQGDRGVMGAAMQTANIKANAEKDNGLSAVAGQLSDWADQEMQDSRRQALEARAEARGIAKEGRVAEREAGLLEASNTREDKLTAEKREYDAPLRDAQVRQANAAARKSDRVNTTDKEKLDKVQVLEPSEIREEKNARKEEMEVQLAELQKKKDEWFNDDDEAGYQAEMDLIKAQYKADLKYLDSFKSIQSRRDFLSKTGGLTPEQKARKAELKAKLGK